VDASVGEGFAPVGNAASLIVHGRIGRGIIVVIMNFGLQSFLAYVVTFCVQAGITGWSRGSFGLPIARNLTKRKESA
jgi:hypothetical protein